jgi:hypothetical protein
MIFDFEHRAELTLHPHRVFHVSVAADLQSLIVAKTRKHEEPDVFLNRIRDLRETS